MQHDHAAHKAFLCSGEPWPAHGGSWIGHVLPGAFLMFWGLHWFVSATYQQLTGARRQPVGAAYHKGYFLPTRFNLQDLEPVFKIVFPAIAIILEFSLSGTQYLRCPPGTAKAGELDVTHMNSWSHATNYPPIILSGMVDLIHTFWVPLPQGIPQFFLSSAFGSSAFLMLAHTKGDPLDALVHQLLGYCMAAVAITVLAQVAIRGQSYALNAAKSLALVMQGCWFLAITHIMFSDDTTWTASHPGDMTRVMFIPVLFAWIFIGVCTALLMLYLAMHLAFVACQQGSCISKPHKLRPGAQDTALASDSDDGLPCSGDSCCEWKARKPWRYLALSAVQQDGEGAGLTAGHRKSDAGSGSLGSDTSVEMV